jgi:hypothetical protein
MADRRLPAGPRVSISSPAGDTVEIRPVMNYEAADSELPTNQATAEPRR